MIRNENVLIFLRNDTCSFLEIRRGRLFETERKNEEKIEEDISGKLTSV